MIEIADEKGYKSICIWKDEEPCGYFSKKQIKMRIAAGDAYWHSGLICMEAKLNPRHISNHALICMKYTPKDNSETEISIYAGEEKISFESKVLPFNRCIYIGLLKEFEEAIEEFFCECPKVILPGGSVEILYGGFDEIGSSKSSFKKTMELLVFVFQHIDRMSVDDLKEELLKLV